MRYAALILALSFVGSCSNVARDVRSVTYPPDLRYVEEDKISASMRALTEHALALDTALRSGESQGDLQGQTLDHLRGMDAAVASLDGAGRATHPMLDRNLGQFRSDLAAATKAVSQDPPSFFLAGTVVGACRYCHAATAK